MLHVVESMAGLDACFWCVYHVYLYIVVRLLTPIDLLAQRLHLSNQGHVESPGCRVIVTRFVIVSPLCFNSLLVLWFSAIVSDSFPDLGGRLLGWVLLVLYRIEHTFLQALRQVQKVLWVVLLLYCHMAMFVSTWIAVSTGTICLPSCAWVHVKSAGTSCLPCCCWCGWLYAVPFFVHIGRHVLYSSCARLCSILCCCVGCFGVGMALAFPVGWKFSASSSTDSSCSCHVSSSKFVSPVHCQVHCLSRKVAAFSACCANYFSFCLRWLATCLIWSV